MGRLSLLLCLNLVVPLAMGCNSTPVAPVNPGRCSPLSHSFISDVGTESVGSTGKIAQSFPAPTNLGAYSSNYYNLSAVTVHTSSAGLTSAVLKIYTFSSNSDPESGNLIGTATLTTGLGSNLATNALNFSFSPNVTLNSGQSYFAVLEGDGATFQVSVNSQSSFSGLIEKETAGTTTWNPGAASERLSFLLSFSVGCI